MNSKHIPGVRIGLSLLLIVMSASVIRPAQADVGHPQGENASVTTNGSHLLYLPLVGKSFSGVAQPGQELTDALAGKYSGTHVTMFGPFADSVSVSRFENSIKEFEQKTGIDIQYEGSNEFESVIPVLVASGNAPDIADFPQPGLLGTFARTGHVLDLGKIINPAWLKQNYNQSWLDMATMPGATGPITAGVWSRINGKSLVWYPKEEFDKAGYQIPQTWDELMALTDQIIKSGGTPWCIGIESGAATGWVMTDWIEDTLLRTTSLDNYDRWARGELKFNSPEIRRAVDYVTRIWFIDSYVYGGRSSIPTTSFTNVPMFDKPPKCWLHRQSSFITSFFPADKIAGKDYDFFYLPPIDAQYGKPFLIAGDIYAAFNDRPEVRAVIQYFSTGESVKGWVEAGGVISPHKDSKLDWYLDPVDRKLAEMILNAGSFRFDGSDLMPGAVGTGSFWREMTAYVSGSIDLATALSNIDATWPKRATPGQAVKMTLLPKFMGVSVFDQASKGAQEAAAELQNPETLLYFGPTPDNSVAGQIQIVTNAAAQGQDAIMISNNAGDQIVPAVKLARNAGMTVVTWDSPIPSAEGEQLYIAPVDFSQTGQVMADMALNILGVDGGKFAVLSASADAANQNAWIAAMKDVLKDPKYSKLQLLDVVYGNDRSETSYSQALALVDKYPDMKLIMAPTTIGIAAAAKAMQEAGLCGREGQAPKVVISGLGVPSQMVSYTKNGCAPQFALWSFVDLGYLTYYATYMLHTGTLRGEKGEQFEAGRLGVYTIENDPNRAAGLRVLLGFKIYDKNNVDTEAR